MISSQIFGEFVRMLAHRIRIIGVSPSGKATDSDSVIRGFESLHPSQSKSKPPNGGFNFR